MAASEKCHLDLAMVSFTGVITSVLEEPCSVEAEVTGLVVAVPGILVLAIVVAPEADGVVVMLLATETTAVVATVGTLVADEAAVAVVVTDVVPSSKVVE